MPAKITAAKKPDAPKPEPSLWTAWAAMNEVPLVGKLEVAMIQCEAGDVDYSNFVYKTTSSAGDIRRRKTESTFTISPRNQKWWRVWVVTYDKHTNKKDGSSAGDFTRPTLKEAARLALEAVGLSHPLFAN